MGIGTPGETEAKGGEYSCSGKYCEQSVCVCESRLVPHLCFQLATIPKECLVNGLLGCDTLPASRHWRQSTRRSWRRHDECAWVKTLARKRSDQDGRPGSASV